MRWSRLVRPGAQGCGGLTLHHEGAWCGAAAVLLAVIPAVLPPYYLFVLAQGLVLAIACLGLRVLFRTGLVSFGHAAYFGVGAYAGGLLSTFFETVVSFEVYLAAGLAASGALAAIFGFICTRATRIHFSILTLALAQLVHALFFGGAVFRLLGGVGKGLFLMGGGGLYIPRMTIAGTSVAGDAYELALYHIIAAAFLLSTWVMWRVDHSPFGQALRAVGQNEARAECIGIRVRAYRWYAFIVSGLCAGLAGALHGQWSRQVTPEQLHWVQSAQLVLATVLGGTERFGGPVAGALAFVAIQEVASRWTLYRLVLGAMLIALVLLFPRGLTAAAERPDGRGRPAVPPAAAPSPHGRLPGTNVCNRHTR